MDQTASIKFQKLSYPSDGYEINTIVTNVKSGSIAGRYGPSPYTLKTVARKSVKQLSHLINRSFVTYIGYGI